MVSSNSNIKSVSCPFWLWPNVLSLDAPCVAVAWQFALARSSGVHVPAALTLALAVAVWSIYVLDRVLDGPGEMSARHLFTSIHRKAFLSAVVGADLLAAFLVLPSLPWNVLAGGVALAAACGAYLITVQSVPQAKRWKSALMAVLFGAGVVLPFPATVAGLAFVPTALVVWANLRLIHRWEEGGPPSLPLRFLLLGGGVALMTTGSRYMESLAVGGWFMLALDTAAEWMDLDLLRFLVDAALVAAVLITPSR